MRKPDEKLLAKQRQGHRSRLRARFVKDGMAALQDYEKLEYLLFLLYPQRDVKPIAKSLLEHYGSVTGILEAGTESLQNFGLTERIAVDLSFLREFMTFVCYEKVADRPFLENSEAAVLYLQTKLGSSKKETLMIFFLDSGRKINGIWEHTGTVNSVTVVPREVAAKALYYHAVGVILVHNHPSGDDKPSRADIAFTQKIYNCLDILDIKLLDHLIVTKNSYRSLMQ